MSSFAVGTQALYDFIDDNPAVDMRDVAYTNSVHIIQQQHRMTAINSAIEVSLLHPSVIKLLSAYATLIVFVSHITEKVCENVSTYLIEASC